MNKILYKGVLDKAQYMIVTVFAFLDCVTDKYVKEKHSERV